jgi:CRP-like cAMP-binding protein
MSKLFDLYGRKVSKGEYIFREGDPGDYIYLVHKGKVKITQAAGNADEEIEILGEAEFIGEMAFINDEPRSANAIALEDCELISMDRESFEASVKENHHFAIRVIRMMGDRLRKMNHLYTGAIQQTRNQNLYSEILLFALRQGKNEKSATYKLVHHEKFSNLIKTKYGWAGSVIESILDELENQNLIRRKKSTSGDAYIAVYIHQN